MIAIAIMLLSPAPLPAFIPVPILVAVDALPLPVIIVLVPAALVTLIPGVIVLIWSLPVVMSGEGAAGVTAGLAVVVGASTVAIAGRRAIAASSIG